MQPSPEVLAFAIGSRVRVMRYSAGGFDEPLDGIEGVVCEHFPSLLRVRLDRAPKRPMKRRKEIPPYSEDPRDVLFMFYEIEAVAA